MTYLEWLKTPPARHAPSVISELTEKLRYLKSLGVHEWPLHSISLSKQRAYAQHVQARRPIKTRELKEATQTIELVCFLRMSVLEFSEIGIEQRNKQSQKLFRNAAKSALTARTRSVSAMREQADAAREILRDTSKSWQARCKQADQVLTELLERAPGNFSSHVRRALTDDYSRVRAHLNGMLDFDFGGDARDAGLAQWNAWRDLQERGATELPADFDLPKISSAWQDLVHQDDAKQALKAFAACTMMSVRKSLRGAKIWVDHSLSYRERDQMLISPEDWRRDRDKYLSVLGLPSDAEEFLEPLLDLLRAGVAAVAEARDKGDVEIGTDGMLHLPALIAAPEEKEPRRTREAIFNMIGEVQFPDVLLEVDAHTNFSEELLGRRADTDAELLSMYAGLLAHGTDIDAKGVAAMIPGISPPQVSRAMHTLEMPGRLRRANARIADFQGRIPIATHWGTGEKASADMIALDASRHLWNARVDPRRRLYAIGAYYHVLDRWGIIYDQPIVLNERQAGVAIEGIEQYNRSQDRIRVSLLTVDTHGYTNGAMAVAKGLKFELCPRLRDLSERKLYLPARFVVPEGIEEVTVKRLSLRAIRQGYDEYLRLLASIRLGRISAELGMRYLSSAAKGDRMQRAAEHIGRLLRSIFLCDYVTIADFRREIHALLSRGESVHQLQRVIYDGRIQPERGRRRDEVKAISGSHALLTNTVLAWNTHHMNAVVEKMRKSGIGIDDDWLRRMGPVHFSHINFRGTLQFPLQRYREALIAKPQASRQLAF